MEMKVIVGLDEETKRIAWEFLTNMQLGGASPKIEITPVQTKVKTEYVPDEVTIDELKGEIAKLKAELEAAKKKKNDGELILDMLKQEELASTAKEMKSVKVEPAVEPVEEVIEEVTPKEEEPSGEADYTELVEKAKAISKEVSKNGKRTEVMSYMKSFDVTRISDIPAERIQEYISGVEAIANAG